MQLGRSESAIMTSSEQARFRIDRPNAWPRATCIVALDERSEAALASIRNQPWNGARFLRYVGARKASEHLPSLNIDAVLRDADGNEVSLVKEISGADSVVMVAATDAVSEAVEIIGTVCAPRGITVTGMPLKPIGAAAGMPGRILSAMRPHASMLVVSSGEDYVAEMLAALRA